MAPKFGTSGLRGLVDELTDPLCAGYAYTFLDSADNDGTVLIGRDLRASSPRIVRAVAAGAVAAGLEPLDCGVVPTPALALAASARSTAAVMVTGSHIPDDRNGLKFYRTDGEVDKADEDRIGADFEPLDADLPDAVPTLPGLADAYAQRYLDFFRPDALQGLRVGVYEHSSAARDVIGPVLEALGAEPIALGRSDRFVPVDTEALDPGTRAMLSGWTRRHRLDAVVSTDGDADRPMVADASGTVIAGDILGPLTAEWIRAEALVTPVSSNTCVDMIGAFNVSRTRIGSPYVIAGMLDAGGKVAGYEANGGFLTGFTAERYGRRLPPLMTRDSLLPILAPLALARTKGCDLATLVSSLPPRFTAADRLVGISTERAAALLISLPGDPGLQSDLFADLGTPASVDLTDGFRAHFAGTAIIHLRPSGNAPEFRVYTEADTPILAQSLLDETLSRVSSLLK
ncbi:MAG: phosphomannomutase [Pseudomonadota bacterium]